MTKTNFPVSSGILCQKHRDKIGSALWEFLWLIDRTTEEKEIDGEIWGIVLGGKPIKANEIAETFQTHAETVKRNLRRLEKDGYIKITRSPYGYILKVRKSMKFIFRKKQELPKNQEIIAELVDYYRKIEGIVEQKGDYPFVGRLYNQYGYDRVIKGINKLGYKIEGGFMPDKPLIYLSGILKNEGGKNSGQTIEQPEIDMAGKYRAFIKD